MSPQAADLAHLLARVALRDRAAFKALYEAASPKLFAICLRLLKDRREAETRCRRSLSRSGTAPTVSPPISQAPPPGSTP